MENLKMEDAGKVFAIEMRERYECAMSHIPCALEVLGLKGVPDAPKFDNCNLYDAEKYICALFLNKLEKKEKIGQWKFDLENMVLYWIYQGNSWIEIAVDGRNSCKSGHNFWVARDGGLETVKKFQKKFPNWVPCCTSWPLR